MTVLTVKERAQINAALCLVHDLGGNANDITELARTHIAAGRTPAKAYQQALNQYAASDPETGRAIGKITALVAASCPRTVAQYDQALTHYISTGDDSALTALSSTIAADSIALAVRNGEMTAEEAQSGNVDKALGFETAPEFQQSLIAANDVDQANAPEVRTVNSQVSLARAATGMRAPGASLHWSDAPYMGPQSATPAPQGLTPDAAREAAKAAALNNGRAMVLVDAANDA